MPSDERVRQALDALAGPLGDFRSVLLGAADEVRGFLALHQSSWDGLVARVGAELGPLAAGRIDTERFASVVAAPQTVDAPTVQAIEAALGVLTDLAARTDALCRVDVPAGGSLHEAVAGALAELGRAFAAARVVAAARAGRRWSEADSVAIDTLPFSRWTRAERRVAPPLVVKAQGADLRAAALSEFLDGRQRIVLVVEGECAPAPLARCIAPGTFVLQTADGTALGRLAACDGPGIAALVPESAARFVHDPGAGSAAGQRLTIEALPEQAPRRALGGLSAAQQAEELAMLRNLAAAAAVGGAPGAAVPAAVGAGPRPEPADKLAAWLLSQVDLSDLG